VTIVRWILVWVYVAGIATGIVLAAINGWTVTP
jgi:hypothetical protein